MKNLRGFFPGFFSVLLLLLLPLAGASAQDDEDDFQGPTPPRLSFIDGEVSYWRAGAEDWVAARRNLPLAEGDALYAGKNSNFEVQFDSRSFVRADEETELSLLNQEGNYLQFSLSRGLVSFDIRSMATGATVEVSTPDAVFTIEQPGYYRVEANGRETRFITRREGRATMTTADGRSLSIYPSEEIVVTAGNPVQVATYAAPPIDAWDRWNDARSERVGEAVSMRYLPQDVYGAEDLDYYGAWRVVPDYGPVWIPRGVAPGWAPYSTGSWIWDPYYEWTWIDDAPWGWAPFHYGRWVFIGSYWAWAPGPVMRRSVYAPALVAFLIRDHNVSVRIGPPLWWVALSWGEPVLPWWGHQAYRWRPHWTGWGGPRIVNNVVINQTNIVNINVTNIHYRNAGLRNAVLTAPGDKFGRERIRATAETRYRAEEFAPVTGEMPIKPVRESLFGGAPKAAVKPPREVREQAVVTTRLPRERTLPWQQEKPAAQPQPRFKFVLPPPREEARALPQRPPFGEQAGPERTPPPQPPRLREMARPTVSAPRVSGTVRQREAVRPPEPGRPPETARRPETLRSQEEVRKQEEVRRPEPRSFRQQAPAPLPPSRPPVMAPAPRPPETAPAPRPAPQPLEVQRFPAPKAPIRAEPRQEARPQPLPGKPANQTYRGREQGARSWENRGGR